MKGLDIYDKKLHPMKDYHIWPELAREQSSKGKSSVKSDKVNSKEKKSSPEEPAKPWKQDLPDKSNRSVIR